LYDRQITTDSTPRYSEALNLNILYRFVSHSRFQGASELILERSNYLVSPSGELRVRQTLYFSLSLYVMMTIIVQAKTESDTAQLMKIIKELADEGSTLLELS